MKKTVLATSILLAMSMPAISQEYQFVLNYDFSTGDPITGSLGESPGGGSDSESGDLGNEPLIPEENIDTWEQFATDNYLSNDFDYLNWSNLSVTSLPTVPYPNDVVGSLSITDSEILSNFDYLSSITEIDDGDLVIRNTGITNLSGLLGITSVSGNIDLSENEDLTDLTGLSSLTYLGGDIRLDYSNSLTSLNGLENLIGSGSLGPSNSIYTGGQVLNDISALSELRNIGDLVLSVNSISDISVLSNLQSVNSLNLEDNQITDLSPISNISVTNSINVSNNYGLNNISPIGTMTGMQSVVLPNGPFAVKMSSSSFWCNKIDDLNELYNFTFTFRRSSGEGFSYSEICQ